MMLKESTIKIVLPAALIAAVCAAVLATHWPSLSAKAFSFDDEQYLTENPLVQNPSWDSAKRFLTEVSRPSTVSGYYQPLTMISLMFDYALGGSETNLAPFHRTSLLLHAANTALVIILLYMLFGNIGAAAAVGLLFGLHPMTVETIPWLGERKTLLAAFFAFWSLLFYIRFTRTKGKISYLACLLAYLLALMSKPTSVPLPLVMLLMDFWPLNRFTRPGGLNRRAIVEKLPFFALAAVFAVITVISQMQAAGGALPGQQGHSFLTPPLIICHNVVFYPLKMLWPVNLTSHYPYPQPFGLSNPKVLAGIIGTLILITLLVISLRWTRSALTGWLIFFIAILPTMQIFRFSDVIASDKFAYLPSLGLLMILMSFLLWLYNNKPYRVIIISVVVLLLAGAETVAVRRYLPYWSNSITLCKYMLNLAPNSVPLYNNLAIAYSQFGEHEKAVESLEYALTIDPNDGLTHSNLGVAHYKLKHYQQAIDMFQKAIRLIPGYDPSYTSLACVYGDLRRFEDMIEPCKKAIELKPRSPAAYAIIGSAYGQLARFPEALEAYKQAAKLLPKNTEVQFGLGIAYLKTGDPNSALQQYEILKRLDPALADRLRSFIPK